MNKYDDSCTKSYSDLSQTTEMNFSRNQSMVLSINYFHKSSIIDPKLGSENVSDYI